MFEAGGYFEILSLNYFVESVAVVTGRLCVGKIARRNRLQRGEMFLFKRNNRQWVLLTNTMAMYLLSCPRRIFVPICSRIIFVGT